MSFDLAVWKTKKEPSLPDARVMYRRLARGQVPEGLRRAGPSIKAFLGELTARYPLSGTFPDSRADRCVWSVDPETVGGGLVLCVLFSKADAVEKQVRTLAERHALVVYDPQSDAIHGPESGWADETEDPVPDDPSIVPCPHIAPLLARFKVMRRVHGRSWGDAFLVSGTIAFDELGPLAEPLTTSPENRLLGCREHWQSVAEYRRYKRGWP